MTGERNVLVTGGAGYIGSHTCKALAAAGYVPVSLDDLSTGNRSAVKWGPLEEGDIRDMDRLAGVIARYRPVAAIHFAALASVEESVENPAAYYQANVVGTLNLARALVDGGVDRVVFSSSAAVYGEPREIPVPEGASKQPVNPYGRTKWISEQMLREFHQAYGLRSLSLRYFNAAGADPDGEIGESRDHETHLIPLALAAASGAGSRLKLFGDDYDTRDGTCIRDYVHVADLAGAHVLAMERLESGDMATALNLASERGFSVKEVIDMVELVTGRAVPYDVVSRRAGDPAVLVADTALAKKELGWAAVSSGLETIVRTAWGWQQRSDRYGRG